MLIKLWKICIRCTGAFLLFALLLVILGVLFTQTPWCRNLVRTVALDAIHKAIHGTVRIGEVDGNLLTRIEVKDVSLVEGSDTIAVIPHLYVRYNPVKILKGILHIDSVSIDTPRLFFRQHDDGKWNLSSAFAPALDREETKKDTVRSTFRISIDRLVIKDASLHTFPHDTSSLYPRETRINLSGSGSYAQRHQELTITGMRATLFRPDIEIIRCAFMAEIKNGNFTLRDFVLTTPSNRIEVNGNLHLSDQTHGSATVMASLPDLTEMAFIVPPDFQAMQPEFHAIVSIDSGQWNLAYALRDGDQSIQGKGAFIKDPLPTYSLQGEFQHLNPAALHLRGVLPGEFDLNGILEVKGQGFNAGDALIHLDISMADSTVHILRLNLDSDYKQGKLEVNGILNPGSGFITFNARCDVLADSAGFSLTAESQNLDIASLLQRPTPNSRITMRLEAGNIGMSHGQLQGQMQISISPSTMENFEIDSGFIQLQAADNIFRLDSLWMVSTVGEVYGAGYMSPDRAISGKITGILRNPDPLLEIIPVEKLAGTGTLGGNFTGRLDSLEASWYVDLHDLKFNDISAAAANGSGRICLENGASLVYGQMSLNHLSRGNVQVDSLNVLGEYGADTIHAVIDARDSTLFTLHADALARLDTTHELLIRTMDITQGTITWSNGQQPILLNFKKSSIGINNFVLTAKDQSILLDGLISPQGESRLECVVHQVDLLPFAVLLDTGFTALGPLDARLSINGRMEDPAIEGTIRSSRITYRGWACDSLDGSVTLRDSILHWDLAAGLSAGDRIHTNGYIPLQFPASKGIIDPARPMDIHLVVPRLEISRMIPSIGPFNTVSGNLVADIHLTQSFQSPGLNGTIGIENGLLKSQSLGLFYNRIRVLCSGKGDALVIDTCSVKGGEGDLIVSGSISTGSTLGDRKIGPTNILVTAREFEAANTSNYAAILNGTTTIRDDGNRFYTEGDLVLSSAHIYLPYFTRSMDQSRHESALPMLVAATTRTDDPAEPQSLQKSVNAEIDSLQRLYGKIRVTIPPGTWIRSKSLNLELSGTLEIVRTSPAIEIIGFVKSERGSYEFYGKKFIVKELRLDFDGGKEINPSVAIDMRYDFRDIYDQQQTLHMLFSNRIKKMTIRFTLGDEAISDGDAISYLLFGRRSDELSQAQQNGAASIGEVVAKDFTAGLISAQLSSTVGNWAGLDVVYVSGEDNWQKATLTAGKYVTRDIFASYEQGLFTSDPNEPVTGTARLDYKFAQFLYLRLTGSNTTTSGVDLIIRIE
jgi:translocation and assembly module TamB